MSTTPKRDKVCLYNMLCAISVEQAKAFLTLQQEQGQLDEADWVEQTEVPIDQLSGWVAEFSAWLENNATKPDVLNAEDPADATTTLDEFVTKVEATPSLVVKRALMGYFAESQHNSWDGWQPYEGVILERFMQDFILNLEHETLSDQPYTIGLIRIENTK